MHMGRKEEAMVRIEKALELDPFNVKIQSFYAMDLNYVRRDTTMPSPQPGKRSTPSATPRSPRDALVIAFFMKGMSDDLMAIERERWAGDRDVLAALERGYTEAGLAGASSRPVRSLGGALWETRRRDGL